MNKLYFRPRTERHINQRCIYYSSLGTERHLQTDIRKLYKEVREFDNPEIARQEVMLAMLANPICSIRKASEL